MKRMKAPAFKTLDGAYEDSEEDFRIIREELPHCWLLSELLFHTITLCHEAYDKISAQMLLDSVETLRTSEKQTDTFFNKTYEIGLCKNSSLYDKFMETIPEGERDSWDPTTYFKKRNEGVPQYQTFIDVGNFILREYRHLSGDLRALIDFAFSGFLFNAVNSLDFAGLCKNKNLDTIEMTLEQKLDEELDHEALYDRLLTQLGHA